MNRNKHGASILLRMEVFEVLNTGEFSGIPLSKEELSNYGISPSEKINIYGDTKELCLKKIKEKLDDLRKK